MTENWTMVDARLCQQSGRSPQESRTSLPFPGLLLAMIRGNGEGQASTCHIRELAAVELRGKTVRNSTGNLVLGTKTWRGVPIYAFGLVICFPFLSFFSGLKQLFHGYKLVGFLGHRGCLD